MALPPLTRKVEFKCTHTQMILNTTEKKTLIYFKLVTRRKVIENG